MPGTNGAGKSVILGFYGALIRGGRWSRSGPSRQTVTTQTISVRSSIGFQVRQAGSEGCGLEVLPEERLRMRFVGCAVLRAGPHVGVRPGRPAN
ncbi:hypothetical protein [Sinosporangium siamense]|uniref:Uncharacterized protein n=1 Tax=Sinosporangium siamense TaxID=1367973 RepID=A0A919RF41_9ACTN|nr:hypothetical protein [Sinosporangium siamense]GII90609.1 hypothetical protein Ssi02_08400 [Sinosporangium siamense]